MENIANLEKKAIDAAITQDWKKAIEYNKQILSQDKNNLDAILRLGFAYFQNKQYESAKKYYKKALKIQPTNPTALENLKRIDILLLKLDKNKNKKEVNLDPNLFLEIPGVTKTVFLVNLGQKNVLAQLTVGEKVQLKIRRRKVEVRTMDDIFIGHLPDDISRRLQILIKAGSTFTAFIKEASLNKIVVFIKEEKRGKKVLKYFPFPISKQVKIEETVLNETLEEENDDELEELTDSDLEELAEALTEEGEKLTEYLPFQPSSEDEEEE
ncbi:MAG: tetratricopeptide repeat protein [Microgenomates group bacterium]